MEPVGKSKIGKLSAKGHSYPQLRLPQRYVSTVGEIADVFETEHEGKQAFLIVTERGVPKEDTVLKPSEEVLKPCADLARPSGEVLTKNIPDSTQRPTAEETSKSTAESFIINTRLVSCAASGSRFACASPGSVAAYHGALSSVSLLFGSFLTKLGVCGRLGACNPVLVSENAFAINPMDSGNRRDLSSLQLTFSRDQLVSYEKWRIAGLDRKSVNWMNKATELVWNSTYGVISKETMDAVRYIALTKYKCVYSQRKVLYFAKGLLK
jgi:hypothetical protein